MTSLRDAAREAHGRQRAGDLAGIQRTSHILYTSGTTGKPKGCSAIPAAYCVALASSIKNIFCGGEGETMFSTSDIGWVVGHSLHRHGPLIAGMATIIRRHAAASGCRHLVAHRRKYKVSVVFSAPTAARVLKEAGRPCTSLTCLRSSTCSSLASRSTSRRTNGSWANSSCRSSTTTGRPKPAGRCCRRCRASSRNRSSSARRASPVYGFNLKIFREDGTVCDPNEKVSSASCRRCPPAVCRPSGVTTRFVSTYFSLFKEPQVYSSFDWGIRDDGDITTSSAVPTT